MVSLGFFCVKGEMYNDAEQARWIKKGIGKTSSMEQKKLEQKKLD